MRTRVFHECRCKSCDALLAKHDRDGLSIRRGAMQTTVTGTDFTVSITCYRCRTLNVFRPRSPEPPAAQACSTNRAAA